MASVEQEEYNRHMSDSLDKLLERARRIPMTSDQAEAQRRSFAYGNAKIENDRVTRKMVDDAADRMAAERK